VTARRRARRDGPGPESPVAGLRRPLGSDLVSEAIQASDGQVSVTWAAQGAQTLVLEGFPTLEQQDLLGPNRGSRRWGVAERREYIRERYRQDGEAAVAEALGLTRRAVKNVAWRLGILDPKRFWTAEEDAVIREWYARPVHVPGFLNELSVVLGRERIAVALRASRLGLTDWHARKVAQRKVIPGQSNAKYTPDERKAIVQSGYRRYLAKHGHPRGALGMKHSAETRAKMGEASRRAWADPASGLNSEANRQRLSDLGVQRVKDGVFVNGAQMYSRAAHGRREDLGGQYFRSAWEANYARFLNWMIERGEVVSWEYEKHTFWFEAIRRGVRSYTPDFRVVFPDGHHEWHEVKGWMDPKSATKLKRMAKYHPAEVVKVIDQEWFKAANRTGLSGVIPYWERRK
jgi:hypothetical protein